MEIPTTTTSQFQQPPPSSQVPLQSPPSSQDQQQPPQDPTSQPQQQPAQDPTSQDQQQPPQDPTSQPQQQPAQDPTSQDQQQPPQDPTPGGNDPQTGPRNDSTPSSQDQQPPHNPTPGGNDPQTGPRNGSTAAAQVAGGRRNWNEYMEAHGAWIDAQKGTLMLVATIVASIACAAGLNPPGGVWQEEHKENGRTYRAGTSVLQVENPVAFQKFYYANVISLACSLSIVFFLATGLPCNRRLYVGMLMLIMAISLISTALSQIFSLSAFTSISYDRPQPIMKFVRIVTLMWIILCSCIFASHLIQCGRAVIVPPPPPENEVRSRPPLLNV